MSLIEYFTLPLHHPQVLCFDHPHQPQKMIASVEERYLDSSFLVLVEMCPLEWLIFFPEGIFPWYTFFLWGIAQDPHLSHLPPH